MILDLTYLAQEGICIDGKRTNMEITKKEDVDEKGKRKSKREEDWEEANNKQSLIECEQSPTKARIFASKYLEENQEAGAMIITPEETWKLADSLPRCIVIREIIGEPLTIGKEEYEPEGETMAFRFKGVMEAMNEMLRTEEKGKKKG